MKKPPRDTPETPEDTPSNVVPIRTPKGQFVKGQSGNPLGRGVTKVKPQKTASPSSVYKRRARTVASVLWKMIESDATPPTVRYNAVREWLDRAHGKPKIDIEMASTSVTSTLDTASLSDSALREIVEASKAQKGSK